MNKAHSFIGSQKGKYYEARLEQDKAKREEARRLQREREIQEQALLKQRKEAEAARQKQVCSKMNHQANERNLIQKD